MLNIKSRKKLMIPVIAMMLLVMMAGNAFASYGLYWDTGLPYTSKSTNTFYTSSAVQIALYSYNYSSVSNYLGTDGSGNPTGYDGDFGNGTRDAVKRFQTLRGLTSDGLVGNNTWDALRENCFDHEWFVGANAETFYIANTTWDSTINLNGSTYSTSDKVFFKKNMITFDWYVLTPHNSFRVFANN